MWRVRVLRLVNERGRRERSVCTHIGMRGRLLLLVLRVGVWLLMLLLLLVWLRRSSI